MYHLISDSFLLTSACLQSGTRHPRVKTLVYVQRMTEYLTLS
jgi:hypothetical protein